MPGIADRGSRSEFPGASGSGGEESLVKLQMLPGGGDPGKVRTAGGFDQAAPGIASRQFGENLEHLAALVELGWRLRLPETDREQIWPLFWKHRGGFFAAHCHCFPDGRLQWNLEQSSQPAPRSAPRDPCLNYVRPGH